MTVLPLPQAREPLPGRRPHANGPGWPRLVLHADRGSASVELVLATPLLLFMLLAIVQVALWSHATHIAQAAASHGLAAARVHGGTPEAGSASAQRVVDQLGRGPLTDTSITAGRAADSAFVEVTGVASSVIPFVRLPVHAQAVGPIERFVPDTAAGR